MCYGTAVILYGILLDFFAIQCNSKNNVMLSKKHKENYFFPFDIHLRECYINYFYIIIFGKMGETKARKIVESLKKNT